MTLIKAPAVSLTFYQFVLCFVCCCCTKNSPKPISEQPFFVHLKHCSFLIISVLLVDFLLRLSFIILFHSFPVYNN